MQVDGDGKKRALQIQGGPAAGTPQIAGNCGNNPYGFCAPTVVKGGVASIDIVSNPVTIKVHNGATLHWQCQLGILSATISDRAYLGCRVVPSQGGGK